MDDFNEKLDRLLSDPEMMTKMQTMLSSMTGKDSVATPPSPPKPAVVPAAPPSDDTALLKALRPYLHGEREKKLEEAIRLMELSKLLPLIRS